VGDGRANSGEQDLDPGVGFIPSSNGPRTVLVVDDDRDVALGVAEVLREYGYAASVAHDAMEALERIAALKPAVAIIDIGMSGMNGYELAKRARERRGGESLRLIALTGYSGATERRLSKDAGFDAHLVKPVDLDALLEAVSAGSARPDADAALAPP
jgi:CheY-like chemotaxis protein